VKRGRVAWMGAAHEVIEAGGCVQLADGRRVDENEVVWLPPLAPTERSRTIFAVGLNYVNQARELAVKAPEEPVIHLKASNSLVGHRGQTMRPAEVTYMHHECELAVVIGRSARRVTRADAYDYVAGYTVANDYAIRDYLENYYCPNFRVAGRDATTPIGPWLVDAADVKNPMNLRLTTSVNGAIMQRGSTADMIFDIAFLIAYLSSFMTLSPGDIILTGAPEGLSGVHAGDEVVTEIGGIGRLVNTIIGDEPKRSLGANSFAPADE
jgi:5-oxopent-3-ene-1,2,5-tricarboxylate decarboxylase / 2-hydroxyhepta-2,4-diene-1,7-dioate isomerase